MPSSTDICNFALELVGDKVISSLDDDNSREAKLCRRHYDQTIDEELRAYVWNVAEAQQQLVQIIDSAKQPILDYEFAYALPTDPYCLRVLQVNDGLHPSRVSGRTLLTNESDIKLRYTKRITDPNLFDALLVKLIYYQIAVKISWPLTQSSKLKNDLLTEITALIEPLAKFIDSTENRDRIQERSGWHESRLGGTGNGGGGGSWC